MKKLDKSTVTILAIVSTILSYSSVLLMVLVGVFFASWIDNPNCITAIFVVYYIVICILLFWGCRVLYRRYNEAATQRKARWLQVLFIFLLSFCVKFLLDGVILAVDFSLLIYYGMDIILIIPVTIAVNLIIANRQERRPYKRAKTD